MALAVAAVSALPLLTACGGEMAAQKADTILEAIKRNAIHDPSVNWCGAADAPADVSWRTALSAENEKGEPLEISGTVYESDGKTPAPNTLIYLYHTDLEGHYGRGQGVAHIHGRYRGWMLTDKNGRYSFRTIKPAPYPENRFAAHIHMTRTTAKLKESSVDSILFEGDKLISAQERAEAGKKGGFNPILTLERGGDGVLRATRGLLLMA